MFEFTPDPDNGPFAAWSWQRRCDAVRYEDAALRDAVTKLRLAGFSAINLPISSSDDDEILDASLRLLGLCRDAGLAVWLRPEMPWRGCLRSLEYEVFDLGSSEAATWRAFGPPESLLALDAVPLNADAGAPRWTALRSLDVRDEKQQTQIVSSLSSGGAGVRVWAWSDPEYNELETGVASWRPLAEKLLALAIGDDVHDVVRGVHLAQLLPAERQRTLHFPWVTGLPTIFEGLHGYSFPRCLAWLVGPIGDDAVRLRRHYWEALSQGLAELYWEPCERFCAQYGLALRGLIESQIDGPALLTTREGGGTTLTPIDSRISGLSLRRSLFSDVAAGNRPPLASSAAGVDRDAPAIVLDWGLTPASCAPHYHRLLLDGSSALETAVAAPFDLARPTVLRQPYAPRLGGFNRELGNLSAAMAGPPTARVGLLWPERSMQAHHHPRGHRNVRWVEEDLCATVSLLDELHFDFVFCDEAHLETARIEPGEGGPELACGAALHRLALIVLPSVTALSWSTWNKLEEFVAAGGKLVCLGLLPRWSERGRDTEFESHISKATMLIVADLYNAYAATGGANTITARSEMVTDSEETEIVSVIGYPVVRSQPSGGRIGCYQPRLNDDHDDARLRVNQLMTESIAPDLETQAAGVRLTRRRTIDGDMVFAVNLADHAQRVNVRVRTESEFLPYRCSPRNGFVRPVYEWMELEGFDGAGAALTLEIGSSETTLLYFTGEATFPHAARSNFAIENFDGNSMRGHATAGGVPWASVWNDADQKMTRWAGEAVVVPPPIVLDGEWQAELGGHNMLALELSGLGKDAFAASFTVAEDTGPLWLRLPACPGEVSLNGQTISSLPEPLPEALTSRAHSCQSAAAIWFTLQCEPGEQMLKIFDAGKGAEPLRRRSEQALLLGNFSFDDAGALTAARPLHLDIGSWHDQGLADYCGEIVLTKLVPIPPSFADCRVFLELHDMRDTVAAEIEGTTLGVCSAPPYRFDATGSIRAGEVCKVVLRIFNTAAAIENKVDESTDEAEMPPAGLLGPVRLVAYPLAELREKS